MSDILPLSVSSSDDEIVDKAIQREWDRFGMPDYSVDHESHDSPLAPPLRSSTNVTFATRAFDSLPAYDSTTALGDAFARAESTDFTDEDTDAPDVRGVL